MNHQRTFHQRLLRSQRGSVLLMAIIGGVVVCIMFFASIAYIESQANMMFRASSKSDRRIVMDGLYAYTVNAIKQSWCMSSTWAEDLTCNLSHARNTQRLLLSDEALLFIRNSGSPHPEPLSATRLASLGTEIELQTLTDSHPLYSILSPIKKEYKKVRFTVERDSTAISAVRGREVPLKITIFLEHNNDTSLDQTLVSKNIVYPRELSYFGLILSNNLFLASGTNDATKGNINLDPTSVTANAGLRFESPIYVNGDLNLPPSSHRPAMSNVIFVDKVVLAGQVMMDGRPYIVKNAGGEDYMYNYNMPNFAGIMGGFEVDPARDTGLDYLFKISGKGELSYDAQQLCRERLMASYSLNLTNDAQLWVKVISTGNNSATLSYNLGNINNFIEQDDVDGYSATTTVPGVTTSAAVTTNATGKPIMKVHAYFNGLRAPTGARGAYMTEFYVHRSGTVTLYPSGPGTAPIVITSNPQVINGRTQYNQVNLSFNMGNLDLAPYQSTVTGVGYAAAPSVKFSIEAYDYGYLNGKNLRSSDAAFLKKINGLQFSKVGGNLVLSANSSDTPQTGLWTTNSGLEQSPIYNYTPTYSVDTYNKRHMPDDAKNWAEFDDQCFSTPEPSDTNADFSAFPAATWDTSFAEQARNSWSFDTDFQNQTIPGYYAGPILYDKAGDEEFHVDSLVKECIVGPNQTLLAGMLTCEKFVIQPRNRPLRIIGTVITNQLIIDESAYKSGIRWSSIYHPQAAQELIVAKILGKDKANVQVDCTTSLAPLWQSNIGVSDRYRHWICNPVSLRTADPFKWSTVDPDCGLTKIKESTSVKCKKRTTRFLIKEVSRGKGL